MKKLLVCLLLLCLLLLAVGCRAREVRSATINEKGELILSYTDGTSSNLGIVKGADGLNGQDGADGKDGKNGVDGQNGKDGKNGLNGQVGTSGAPGEDGRGIASVGQNASGQLVVTYDDGSEPTVLDLAIPMLGGACGEAVEWALYNGGLLIIAGEGATYDYAEGATPWAAFVAGIRTVYIDTVSITPGANLLYGFGDDVTWITPETTAISVWVDMTEAATVYKNNDATDALGTVAFGTELTCTALGETMCEILYEGGYGYVETKYVNQNPGSLVFTDTVDGYQMKVVGANGLNLRTFTDASNSNNLVATLAKDAIVSVTGISQNGNWARIAYEIGGETKTVYGRIRLNDTVYLEEVTAS